MKIAPVSAAAASAASQKRALLRLGLFALALLGCILLLPDPVAGPFGVPLVLGAVIQNERTQLADLLKNVYEKFLNAAIQRDVFLLNLLKSRAGKFDARGKQYVFATHLKTNTLVASRGANDYYEDAQPEDVKQGVITPSYVHIPFDISHDLLKAARGGDKTAFKEGMRLVMDSSKATLTKDLNRQAAGDQTGVLATYTVALTGGGASATATVDSTQFLEDGMLMDQWNGTTNRNTLTGPWLKVSVVLSDTTFTAVMSDGTNIFAGGAIGDVLIRKGNAFVSGTRKTYETNGLRLFADDGTLDPAGGLHGISASSYSRWKGILLDAANADNGPGIASGVGIKFRQRTNSQFNTIWTNPIQAHALIYGGLGSYQDKRYVDGKVEQIGANEEDVVVNVAGRKVRIRSDVDIVMDREFFFDSAALRYGELNGVELEEQADGQYFTPWRDATGQRPAQKGYWMFRGNFGAAVRNAIALVYNLKKPASIPWL